MNDSRDGADASAPSPSPSPKASSDATPLPSSEPAGPRRAARGRRLAAVAVLAIVAAVAGAAVWRARGRVPAPPEVDLSAAPAAVAQLIADAREAVARTPRDAEARGRLGMALFAHQYDGAAASCFEQAAALDDDEPRWPYLQSLAVASTDRDAAIRLLRRALELRDDIGAGHNRLGELLLSAGDYEAAEEELQAARRTQPKMVRPLIASARVALLRGDLDAALKRASEAAQMDSRDRTAHELLSEIHRRREEHDAALREIQIAETLPAIPLGWHDGVAAEVFVWRRDNGAGLQFASQLLREQKPEEAIQLLHELLQADESDPQVSCLLGRACDSVGRHAYAVQVLERAARRHPDSAEVFFQLGVSQLFLEQNADAKASFAKALEIKPDYVVAQFNLGHALLRLQDPEAALQAFQAAARDRPSHLGSQLDAARILLDQNKPAEALRHLDAALRFHPADRQAEELRQRAQQDAGKSEEKSEAKSEPEKAGKKSEEKSVEKAGQESEQKSE